MNDKGFYVSWFKRKDQRNKYYSQVATQTQNQYLDYYLIDPSFVIAVKPYENSVNMNVTTEFLWRAWIVDFSKNALKKLILILGNRKHLMVI